jgi:hypothetical protein
MHLQMILKRVNYLLILTAATIRIVLTAVDLIVQFHQPKTDFQLQFRLVSNLLPNRIKG